MPDFLRGLVKRNIEEGEMTKWANKAFFSDVPLEKLYNQIVENVSKMFGSPICVLLLLEEGSLAVKAAVGIEKGKINNVKIKIGESMSGRVAKSEKPLVVDDVENYAKNLSGFSETYYRGSFASAPMVVNEQIIGVLNICRPDGKTLCRDNLHLLLMFSSQVALSIVTKKLIEEKTRELFEKTKELEAKNRELERFEELIVGRELKMVELKEKLAKLESVS